MALSIVFEDYTAEIGAVNVQIRKDGKAIRLMSKEEFWARGGDTLVCSREQARRVFKKLLED